MQGLEGVRFENYKKRFKSLNINIGDELLALILQENEDWVIEKALRIYNAKRISREILKPSAAFSAILAKVIELQPQSQFQELGRSGDPIKRTPEERLKYEEDRRQSLRDMQTPKWWTERQKFLDLRKKLEKKMSIAS